MNGGLLHLVFAIVAMVSGAWVLAQQKGGPSHRRLGWLFVGSMIGVNATALLIYDLTGSFGPFHGLAIISLTGVLFGVGHVRLRRPARGWREFHAYWMAWSYVGLLAAAASEAATRIPESSFWWMVVGASGAVVAVGWIVIARQLPRTLGRTSIYEPRAPSTGASSSR